LEGNVLKPCFSWVYSNCNTSDLYLWAAENSDGSDR